MISRTNCGFVGDVGEGMDVALGVGVAVGALVGGLACGVGVGGKAGDAQATANKTRANASNEQMRICFLISAFS